MGLPGAGNEGTCSVPGAGRRTGGPTVPSRRVNSSLREAKLWARPCRLWKRVSKSSNLGATRGLSRAGHMVPAGFSSSWLMWGDRIGERALALAARVCCTVWHLTSRWAPATPVTSDPCFSVCKKGTLSAPPTGSPWIFNVILSVRSLAQHLHTLCVRQVLAGPVTRTRAFGVNGRALGRLPGPSVSFSGVR